MISAVRASAILINGGTTHDNAKRDEVAALTGRTESLGTRLFKYVSAQRRMFRRYTHSIDAQERVLRSTSPVLRRARARRRLPRRHPRGAWSSVMRRHDSLIIVYRVRCTRARLHLSLGKSFFGISSRSAPQWAIYRMPRPLNFN
jgi:hypothetical protein